MSKNDVRIAKKPRSKVSRACRNCRRRKIKCTGKQPCTNCITYGCECIYLAKSVGSGSNGNLESVVNSALSSADTLNESVDTSSNVSTPSQKAASMKKAQRDSVTKEHIFDPVLDCVRDACEASKNSSKSSHNPMFSSFAESITSMVREKPNEERDLASMKTLQPIFGDNGLYQDDGEFQSQIIQLQTSLKHLKAIPNASELIVKSICSIENQVEKLVASWEPQFDTSRFANINLGNSPLETKSMKSIETHLMKNKYTDQVYLTTFSIWSENAKSEKNTNNNNVSSFFRNKPLVDALFGLYSPLQSLSLRGIGHFFQKCAGGPESKDKTIQLKESLYLLLRFFDICIKEISKGCVSIANPLEEYLRRRNIQNVRNTVGSPGSATNRDLVSLLINQLPQPFVQNLTTVTNEKLLQKVDDDFVMFDMLLKMFDSHKSGFENLMMQITSNETSDEPSKEITQVENEEFLSYCKEEELLLALCYNYYNSTLYHFDEYIENLNYFELLISFLQTQIWLREKYGYEKVLDVAISYSRRLGLSRWEFYVGLDEETAERRRRAWWTLYCIEKKNMCKTGRLSSLDDSRMNCLLPKEFRDVNFTDNKDFLAKVHLVPKHWAFDGMSISSLTSYGECATLQVASNFYANVLYGERYTSIRNTAKPHYLKIRLLGEVFEELEKLKAQFEAIKKHTSKLFDIATSSQSYSAFVSKTDRNQAVAFALFHGCILFSVLISTANLIARLFVQPKSPSVLEQCMKFATIIYDLWRDMTSLLLSLEDNYTIGRVFVDYGVVCLLVASTSFEKCTFIKSIDEVVTFLRVFKRLRNIVIFKNNKNNEIVTTSKVYQSHAQLLTLVGITTNNMLLGYMHDNKLDRENLFYLLEQCAPDIADLPSLVLNPKSDIYELLMQPVESCGFHLDVRRLLEKDTKMNRKEVDSSSGSFPKTAVQLTPSGSEVSPKTVTGSQSLSPVTPIENRNFESTLPTLPPIKHLTSPHPAPYTPGLNHLTGTMDQVNDKKLLSSSTGQPNSNDDHGLSTTSLNLGTLDEFVNNGDLNDIFNKLWSDIDESNQSLFGMDELNEYLSRAA